MAFFQPGDAKQTGTDTSVTNKNETSTAQPSRALAGAAQTKLGLLAALLNAAGSSGMPSFAGFAGGQDFAGLPGGLGNALLPLIQLMGQPGAFDYSTHLTGTDTTTGTNSSTLRPPTPSTFSDLATLATVGALANQSGLIGDSISGGSKLLDWLRSGASSLTGYGSPSSLSPGAVYGNILTPTGQSGAAANAAQQDMIDSTANVGTVSPSAQQADASQAFLSAILNLGGYY